MPAPKGMAELTQAEIRKLAKRFPLPDGVDDEVLNQDELAEVLGVSLPTISDWIKQGMPVQQVGGKGRSYELRLSHCWAWRQGREEDERLQREDRRAKIASLRLNLVGGGLGDSIEGLAPKERREIYTAQIEGERLAAQRNQLMRRDDVKELLEELFGLIRNTLESAPDKAERQEALPPKAVEALIELCDGLVDGLRVRIERFWEMKPVDSSKARENLFDS